MTNGLEYNADNDRFGMDVLLGDLFRDATRLRNGGASGDHAGDARLLSKIETAASAARWALVQQMRYDGHSWQSVGEVLGVSRQAAYEKYRGGLDYVEK